MQQKFTPIEIERLFSFSPDKRIVLVHPKAQTLRFIKQFASVYHVERELAMPVSGMILN